MNFLSINITPIFLSILETLCILLLLIVSGAFMSIVERKLLAIFQSRYGPNRVGWYGSLQLVADMIKIVFKEDWIPRFSNRWIFVIAPIIAFMSLLLVMVIIPITSTIFIIDLNIGFLFFLMMAALSVYSILFAGWASNNKYALLGAVRASAQTLSYEIFLGLSLMGVAAQSNSFNMIDIVNSQKNIWNIIPQFFGFITFFISSLAVCHRHPFDQPESEQELADGYHIEYSGMKFGLFFIGEYIAVIIMCSLITTLFLGGWNGPWMADYLWFFLKTIILIIFFVLIRAALPRPRYDKIMLFGWKFCFPITLLNVLVTGFILLL